MFLTLLFLRLLICLSTLILFYSTDQRAKFSRAFNLLLWVSSRDFARCFLLLFSSTGLGFVYLWVSSTRFVLYYGFQIYLLGYF